MTQNNDVQKSQAHQIDDNRVKEAVAKNSIEIDGDNKIDTDHKVKRVEGSEFIAADNNIDLAAILTPYHRPDEQTIVCGALDDDKVQALADAGVELVINLQPDEELSFDEAVAVAQAGMAYEHLPISGADDLKQLKVLAFDNLLRQYHGKKIAMHCKSGSRVGAVSALRAGWLRGRKIETAMERGYSHGLTEMFEQETHNRLLVPR